VIDDLRMIVGRWAGRAVGWLIRGQPTVGAG
jgi:hypothetical protein